MKNFMDFRKMNKLCSSVFSNAICEFALKNREQTTVRPFPLYFLNRLRPYLCAGIPLNVIIGLNEMCVGKCYQQALYSTLAFDKCDLVHAKSINSLLGGKDEEASAGHAFVETNGKVFDTTAGLMFDKDFYYDIERPVIESKRSKEECINENFELQTIISADTESNKILLPLTLPNITKMIKTTKEPITQHYKPYLLHELAMYKKGINYKDFMKEEKANMQLFKTDPAALDEKLGIVRDENGRIISRDGVPDPNYAALAAEREELSAFNDLDNINNIAFQKSKEKDFLEKLHKELDDEKREVYEKAQKRLSKIALRPTAYAYEIDR
ncbi:MAG: hypothetical protein LBQ05_00870 [Christensenellaceae bacterium]|jgi:hypothetical protein|nr:hypothetical protein [Christensenellaceae bacterium]